MCNVIDDCKIPTFKKRKGKRYCKFHNIFGHWTNNCSHFRDMIQKAIDKGRLKFEETPRKVDTMTPSTRHTYK